jgi:hypothetical protein
MIDGMSSPGKMVTGKPGNVAGIIVVSSSSERRALAELRSN